MTNSKTIKFGSSPTFYESFSPELTFIKEFKYWLVLLRKKQETLGSVVIILKNKKESIADVKPEEFSEFPAVVKWFESSIKETFGAEKFNYLAAMMKDNYVHFHGFPRYSKVIKFSGKDWKDSNWPKTISNMTAEEESPEIIGEIIKSIK
jgi:diadenosine tetraphosphate (Ap4A) HIT family hydrolase